MAEFKDKLFKVKKQKLDPLEVVYLSNNVHNFCFWIVENFDDLRSKRIFSLKRLARIYLSENPDAYTQYEMAITSDKENIRIAQNKSFWEED